MKDLDYCADGKHVTFPPQRTCYCGSIFFFGPLPSEEPKEQMRGLGTENIWLLTEEGPLPIRSADLCPAAQADLESWVALMKERYQWPLS